jgi:amidohydrolase
MKKAVIVLLLVTAGLTFAQEKGDLEKRIAERIEQITPELIEIRRHIHENPERGNREFKTAALVAERLKALGFTVTEKVAHTGVVGILEGNKPGRIVAVRADMDALPILEKADVPFKSKVDGVMHACGHDIHTTIALGTAMVLAGMKDRLPGTVKFLFQPAEEGSPAGESGGASLMIKEGVLTDPAPEVIFGLHVGSGLPVGMIAYVSGGALASNDSFEIVIQGKGVHASMPWGGVDSVVTASQVVMALQNIRSRMTDTRTPFVLSVSTIHGGTAFNIIPEEIKMTGTIRTTGWSVKVLKTLMGDSRIMEMPPVMGSEDFAYYSQEIPAFFYFLGITDLKNKATFYPVHSPYFCADEGSIPVGVEAMVNLVLSYLESDFEATWRPTRRATRTVRKICPKVDSRMVRLRANHPTGVTSPYPRVVRVVNEK